MKTLFTTTAAAALLMASVASAENFKETQFRTVLQAGNMEFSMGTVQGELDTIETRFSVARYTLGNFDNEVMLGVGYGRLTDTLAFTMDYNVETSFDERFGAYGIMSLAYVTPTGALDAGDLFVTPTLGLSYALTPEASVYGDVSYTWVATNAWAQDGGAVELGLVYDLTDSFSMNPAIVRTFNTESDRTNFKLELTYRF